MHSALVANYSREEAAPRGPAQPREAQRRQARPNTAQRGPERPREAQKGPERPGEAQRGPERPIEVQRGPERLKEAKNRKSAKNRFKRLLGAYVGPMLYKSLVLKATKTAQKRPRVPKRGPRATQSLLTRRPRPSQTQCLIDFFGLYFPDLNLH